MENIGKVIYNKTQDLVNGKCYPLIAEETTKKPFIIYRRESTTPHDTKDRLIYQEDHFIMISIVTEKYDEGVMIAEKVFERFDNLEGNVSGINIHDTEINGISEDYVEGNNYIQNITINIKTI